ncbi:hypothetical protein HYV50_05305 [Candidatus Pacearchaeota archaeon]|nr:hypothetical protein [Candidatus Pacearchaeota archaeon]
MKREFFLLSVLILVFSIGEVSALQGADFAIYNGKGTWEPSKTAFKKFLEWKGLTWEEVSAWDINNRDLRPLYKGIFMPGGWAYDYKKAIKTSGNNNIRNLISSGGVYIGMSAGAYYACDNVVWDGGNYPYYLNLFHGSCIGPINEIASWPNYVMTTMDMNLQHEANVYEPAQRGILYYGEPYFVANAGQEMQTFATWIVPSNSSAHNKPGIIGFNYGQGRVLLVGPHPEIDEDDSRDGTSFADELSDGNDGSDWPFLWTSVDWLMKGAITIPPGATLMQCADGIDNDLDGFIDYPADVGCSSTNDNDETNVVSPSELFFDGFEAGNLNNWILTGIDTNWYASSSDNYAGTGHAEAQPMNTNEPASSMEKTISTIGHSNVELSYSRKLVGLDIADEFKAKWFDGSAWNVLEQVGDGSANDANYVYRTFTLPTSAGNNANFRIRFECTAGAVSEFCKVDDVRIVGN